jgi:nucleotide-binding universal stress UspA family protein
MFHRILLAWPRDTPPTRSLLVARSLAEVYDAELTVCCLGDGAVEAQAAAGADVVVESLPAGHVDRELLQYAHEHAFDLLVIGRAREAEHLARQVIDWASLPVLVVAEEPPA